MPKPILVIKIKNHVDTERFAVLQRQAMLGLKGEYHVLVVPDPYIQTEISFEVHGIPVYSIDEIKTAIDANTSEK